MGQIQIKIGSERGSKSGWGEWSWGWGSSGWSGSVAPSQSCNPNPFLSFLMCLSLFCDKKCWGNQTRSPPPKARCKDEAMSRVQSVSLNNAKPWSSGCDSKWLTAQTEVGDRQFCPSKFNPVELKDQNIYLDSCAVGVGEWFFQAVGQRTPWGGEKRGGWKTSRMTPLPTQRTLPY